MAQRSNADRSPPGSVRIIAGTWRGRRVPLAAGTTARPTPDRVRETLFNWLRDALEGARCLDLFAGSGVLGFEALSRGAAETWFVERDAMLVAALEAQSAVFGVRPRIVRQEATVFLRGPATQRFDVLFLDPPYTLPIEPLVALLLPWLAAEARIYVERPRGEGLPAIAAGEWVKRGRAGAVEFGLLRLAAAGG